MNFEDLINSEANEGEEEIEDNLSQSGASYLQKHLADIQDYLNEEISTRRSISSFLALLLAQSANYTFSLILISAGAEFFSSTIIGLIIGLMPGLSEISRVNQQSNKPIDRYLPVVIKGGIALFTSGIIFTQITLPHLSSRSQLDKVYADIQLIEGQTKPSVLDNLKTSPITPIAAIVLLVVGFKMAMPSKES